MLAASSDNATPLLGRAGEIEVMTSLLDGISTGGGALLFRGEPGVGKSRLMAEAARLAGARGFQVLSATGVQSEAQLPFAGLHQLLRPVRGREADLPDSQHAVLDAAFGIADGPAPEHFRIAMAVLDLLADVATESPLLVIAEDSHWLDRPSADVLAFVARRLESDPIVLLATARDGHASAFDGAGLPEHRLEPIDAGAAAELIDASPAALTPAVRADLLNEAAGNPLALIELPIAAAASREQPFVPGVVPLTQRLERAFTARMSELPADTRAALLVTALDDGDRVAEVLEATRLLTGHPVTVDALEPAVRASIVELDPTSVRFRHPLMRSAIVGSAGVAERLRAHEALAGALAEEPDRRVWHRAALIPGEHEEVAAELEATAGRARRRGAIDLAMNALRRAAELSEPERRVSRLLAAAGLAFELGRPDAVDPLLRQVHELDPGPLDRARATWIEEVTHPRPLGDAARATGLIDAAGQAGSAGDSDLQMDLLWLVAQRAWWAEPSPEARQLLVREAKRLGALDDPDRRVLAVYAYADPLGHARAVRAELESVAAAGLRDSDTARHFGAAATVGAAFDVGFPFLAAATDGLRAEGRLGHLPRMLAIHGMGAVRLTRWDVAIPAAEESRRLAGELGEKLWEAGADTVAAMIAGMRGELDDAEAAAERAERVGVAAGANFVVALAQFGRVLALLAAGRHGEAYASCERLFDPADPGHHPPMGSWLIGDLAEAAVHCGRADAALEHVAQVEAAAGDEPANWIAIGLRHARALLAPDGEAADRYEEALAADLRVWPFERARLLFAYGQWLRRQRRVAESRGPLRSARDVFDAIGCVPWGNQARRELRASGETSRRHDPEARDKLTAQELQIAQLAATGLTNREIGQKLYLSHRTIGTHLYRIFPKLGITARSELRDALQSTS